MMFCVNCGKQLESDSTFCTSCGARVHSESQLIPMAKNTLSLAINHPTVIKFMIPLGIGCLVVVALFIGMRGSQRDLSTPSSRLIGQWRCDSPNVTMYFGPIDKNNMGSFIPVEEEGKADKCRYEIINEDSTGTNMLCKFFIDETLDDEEVLIECTLDGKSLTMTQTGGLPRPISLKYIDSKTQPDLKNVIYRDIKSEESYSQYKDQVFESQNNLKQLGLVFKMYSNESVGEVFPQLSSIAGCLMFDKDSVYPEYLTDSSIMRSPLNENESNILDTEQINDNSYIYFGYCFTEPEDVDIFLNAYKAFTRGELTLSEDIVETISAKTVYRLREGVERFLITDINNPGASAMMQSTTPIIFERRSFCKDGAANVLFLDGHVDKVAPGENAVIDRIFELLPEFDALKESK